MVALALGTGVTATPGGYRRRRGSSPAPRLAGSGRIGAGVTADPGAWSGMPVLGVQWTLNGTDLPGATGWTYFPVPADDRGRLAARVVATNAAGTAETLSEGLVVTRLPPGAAGRLQDLRFLHKPGFRDRERSDRLHRRGTELQRRRRGRVRRSRDGRAPHPDRHPPRRGRCHRDRDQLRRHRDQPLPGHGGGGAAHGGRHARGRELCARERRQDRRDPGAVQRHGAGLCAGRGARWRDDRRGHRRSFRSQQRRLWRRRRSRYGRRTPPVRRHRASRSRWLRRWRRRRRSGRWRT